MRHFKHDEFPEPWSDANPILLTMLDDFRDDINKAIFPSLAPGALCRYSADDMGSQHYAVGRQSTAVDVFIPGATPAWIITRALLFGFDGVGVYFDTHNNRGDPETMYHFDIRRIVGDKPRTVWYREHKKYHWIRNAEHAASGFFERIARGYNV